MKKQSNTYADILKQKQETEQTLNTLNQEIGGAENSENMKILSKYENEKSKLSNEIYALNQKHESIREKISEFGNDGEKKLLETIKNQRWFFFRNKTKIVFDKTTGYLWPNLDYYEFVGLTYDGAMDYIGKMMIENIEKWRIPILEELKNINVVPINGKIKWVSNSNVPGLWIKKFIKEGANYWTHLQDFNTADYGEEGSRMNFIPVNDALFPQDFKNNISPGNKIYTDNEKAKMTLDIFIQNDWIPIFDNPEHTEIYKKLYIEKPELAKKLADLEEKLNEMKSQEKISAQFNFKDYLMDYNIEEADKSIIQYCINTKDWIDNLLTKLEALETEKSDIFNGIQHLAHKIDDKISYSKELNDSQKETLEKRWKFIKRHFDFGTERVKNSLLDYKNEAEKIEDKIIDINTGTDKISKLYELETMKKPSFYLMAENTAEIVRNNLIAIEWFEENRPFVEKIFEWNENWKKDYEVFAAKLKNDFYNNCTENSIDEEHYKKWFEDWTKERNIIEEKLLPILEQTVKKNINPELVYNMVEVLENYKKDLDNFYLSERKNIHTKFAFTAGGELQEKFEKEMEVSKIINRFQENIEKIVFKENNTSQEKIFIIKWAKGWLDYQVDEVITFIADKNITAIAKEIVSSFRDLKRRNFEAFMLDVAMYTKAKKERESEYNELMFKMRKELNKPMK